VVVEKRVEIVETQKNEAIQPYYYIASCSNERFGYLTLGRKRS